MNFILRLARYAGYGNPVATRVILYSEKSLFNTKLSSHVALPMTFAKKAGSLAVLSICGHHRFVVAAGLVLQVAAWSASSAMAGAAGAPPPEQATPAVGIRTQPTASVPRVAFDNGLLSIRAEDCVLGDVLKAVEAATGVAIDSASSPSERVSVDIGPGKTLDVLASLLNASSYDYYILLGPQQQGNSVSRITLTPRGGGQAPMPNGTSELAMRLQGETKGDLALDPKRLQEVQREQQRQFEQRFGACIAQGCDQS